MSSKKRGEITIQNLFKTFDGEKYILKNINLKVRAGEFVVLLGPSGCGKSTLLRIISGLEKPSSGKIFIDNQDISNLPPKDRDIAMVFQSYALYPHLTVYENIAFSLKIKGVKKEVIDKKVRETAKMLGIEHHLMSKPKEISGGERQRVAVGRAIIRNPKVFLFDEPLSNLDAQLRTQMRAEFKKLHKNLGITTLYVTHDQIEAMTLGDRIIVLKDGEILQEGKPNEIYSKPLKKFVAEFLGSPPMNFIEGQINNGYFYSEIGLKKQIETTKDIENTEVFLGIRPEDIKIDINKAEIKGSVEFKEILGNSIIFYVKIGENIIKVKSQSDYSNEILPLFFPEEKIFIYSKDSKSLIFPK